MARRIYGILIAISLGLGVYLYSVKETHSNIFIIVTSGIIFTCLSMGIHGLIAHSLNPKAKGGILLYPILMGVLWAFLFFLFVFFILPIFCPDFLIRP
jgi:magnesium-transporting ATPase (P-type)